MKPLTTFQSQWIALLNLSVLTVFFLSCGTDEPNVAVLKKLYSEGINYTVY